MSVGIEGDAVLHMRADACMHAAMETVVVGSPAVPSRAHDWTNRWIQ